MMRRISWSLDSVTIRGEILNFGNVISILRLKHLRVRASESISMGVLCSWRSLSSSPFSTSCSIDIELVFKGSILPERSAAEDYATTWKLCMIPAILNIVLFASCAADT